MAVGNPVDKYLEGIKFNEDLQTTRLARETNQFNLDAARAQQEAEAEAARQAAQAEQAGQTALQGLLDNPNPTTKDYLQAWVANPAMREEITSLRDMQTTEQNNALITKNTNLYAAAKSGNVNVVRRLLDQETEAARNSGDDQTVAINEAGVELLERDPEKALATIVSQTGLMLLGLKDPKFLEEINTAVGAGTPEQTDAFKTLSARAEAAGLVPGTDEYAAFMLNNGEAAGGGFRQATPEEAAEYGAAAGQFGPDGRFYPVDPPSGLSIKTNPDGTFSFEQGSNVGGASGGKDLPESQSKSVTYATRARGALADFEPVADQLAKRKQGLLEIIPLGLGREYQDPLYQQAQASGTEFLQAILRKDTGAAITQEETEQYGKVYLPQPGDSPEALAQKKKARKRAAVALEAGMTADAMIALEAASGNAKNFATMTIDQIRALDPDALTEEEAEQALARLEELGG